MKININWTLYLRLLLHIIIYACIIDYVLNITSYVSYTYYGFVNLYLPFISKWIPIENYSFIPQIGILEFYGTNYTNLVIGVSTYIGLKQIRDQSHPEYYHEILKSGEQILLQNSAAIRSGIKTYPGTIILTTNRFIFLGYHEDLIFTNTMISFCDSDVPALQLYWNDLSDFQLGWMILVLKLKNLDTYKIAIPITIRSKVKNILNELKADLNQMK